MPRNSMVWKAWVGFDIMEVVSEYCALLTSVRSQILLLPSRNVRLLAMKNCSIVKQLCDANLLVKIEGVLEKYWHSF